MPTETGRAVLTERLAGRPKRVQDLAFGIRDAVLDCCDAPTELVYDTYALSVALTYSGRLSEAFIHIATYKQHVNLGFNKGAFLDDPKSLLSGSGSAIRHIRINALSMLANPDVVKLITAAEQRGMEAAVAHGPIPESSFKVMTKKKSSRK